MLKVENIHVYYGAIHAVKGVSLEVNEGEIVTLIGANGAGKSTVLKTISGLLRAQSGAIGFMGESIASLAPHKIVERGLAQVPEGRRIFLQMTVQENLEMGAYTRPAAAAERMEKVYAQFPRLLERRTQVSRPKLLMLDEPSMGLAPILVEQIFSIISELNKAGTTILLVEQNAQMALSIADRAYVLETGRIALSGTGKELSESDEIRRAYLGG
jgi:branched-chain amino acid transport system ATP-binding protein